MKLILAGLIALLLMGCDAASPVACQQVSGTVTRGGKPVAGAMVVFHPVAEIAGLKQKPMAVTDEAGQFSVTTFERGDGAPVGEYQVTVVQRAPKLVGEEIVREGPNLLPRRLSEPATSGVAASIVAGENMLSIVVPQR